MYIKLFLSWLSFVISTVAYAENQFENHDYVGRKVCAQCHIKQTTQWFGSHHDLAMQPATRDTVLGDFKDSSFSHHDVTSRFFMKGDEFWVNTDDSDDQLRDFRIQYTFGIYPLQQYLIAHSGGRLQVLDIAWDSRPKIQGGQRWFALHEEKIAADDVLHWTGPNLNWNYMCADCHSTNLEKNYQAETQTYDTKWSEIDVACEACHGPGRAHQQWALDSNRNNSDAASPGKYKNKGLTVALDERKGVTWRFNPEDGKPFRSEPRQSQTEIETCARCHSRRGQIGQPNTGESFMDNFRPAFLTPGLYYADGQIQDEVYVYGSFLQSKMYQAGVTCSDCHDPHSAELKLPDDRVCNQCHLPERYRSINHHHHPANALTTCIDCHMPVKTYMGVDQRHDHSFRIPRPEISQAFNTPDVCLQCHTDKTSEWTRETVHNWYPDSKKGLQLFAPILDAQRKQPSRSNQQAIGLLQNSTQPGIARATIMSQLSANITEEILTATIEQLKNNDPMLRVAALMVLGFWSESGALTFDVVARLSFPLLEDPIRLVRIEAARVLAAVDETQLQKAMRVKLLNARQEYIDSLLFNAERPESQVNLGNFYFNMKNYAKSEQAYRQALALQGKFVPAWINLAQFYSELNRDKDALQTLQQGLEQINEPDNADLYHAMGLTQVRLKSSSKALASLAKAAQLAPDNAHYGYVYGIALNSYKGATEALKYLRKSHQRHPENHEILNLLLSISQDSGQFKAALQYAEKILALEPDNAQIKALVAQLKTRLP